MVIKQLANMKSVNNNSVSFLSYETKEEAPLKILFLGTMHGEEPQGDFLINKFLEKIKDEKPVYKNNLYFIPCLNPDGKELGQRGNLNKVDLNRNFKTKNYEVTTFDDGTTSGKFAQSEQEVSFLAFVVDRYKFDVILSIHAPFEIVNFDGPAKNIAQKISDITGYPVQADIGYPTPGSFGTFCGVDRNIPIITLEVSDKMNEDELWAQNQPVFEYLANLTSKNL